MPPDPPVSPVTLSPVESIPVPEKGVEDGLALCLSGGGYRAMLFHLGTVWRLYETGILREAKRISSVSGGSITAGVLGMEWGGLGWDPPDVAGSFVPRVVDPVRSLAGRTLDAHAVIEGLLLPGTVGERIAGAYDEHLFHGKTLQDLPDEPRFVINASNVQSGALWRFMKPYMADWRVGVVNRPEVPLAVAVAASSAFPPVLSPLVLDLDPRDFTPDSGKDLQRLPFTTDAVLTDGGVYDNLGLETAWKRYGTIRVSDAGGKTQPEGEPKRDWGRHAYRILNLIDDQVRSLRKRQLIGSFEAGIRRGAYWGIRTDISDYGLADSLPCPHPRTLELAETATRLKRLENGRQERLINWGYAVCDAALRRHYDAAIPKPGGFPYPDAGV